MLAFSTNTPKCIVILVSRIFSSKICHLSSFLREFFGLKLSVFESSFGNFFGILGLKIILESLYDLRSLRLILTTGSPLKPSSFEFLNAHVRPHVVIGSICGGTDIIGCFMGATLNRPVHAGECQHFYLGMDMHAFNSKGKPQPPKSKS